MLFSPFLSRLYLQHLSQLQLSPPISALLTFPWSHTWSCSPYPHTNYLYPSDSSSSPPSVLPGPGLLQLVPGQAGRVWVGSDAWQYATDDRGSSTWQRVCCSPLLPPTGCFFMTTRAQLPESWLPTKSSPELKGCMPGCWCLSALWEVQQDPLN